MDRAMPGATDEDFRNYDLSMKHLQEAKKLAGILGTYYVGKFSEYDELFESEFDSVLSHSKRNEFQAWVTEWRSELGQPASAPAPKNMFIALEQRLGAWLSRSLSRNPFMYLDLKVAE